MSGPGDVANFTTTPDRDFVECASWVFRRGQRGPPEVTENLDPNLYETLAPTAENRPLFNL